MARQVSGSQLRLAQQPRLSSSRKLMLHKEAALTKSTMLVGATVWERDCPTLSWLKL